MLMGFSPWRQQQLPMSVYINIIITIIITIYTTTTITTTIITITITITIHIILFSLYFSSSRSHRVEMYGRVVQNESVLKILYKTKTYYMRTG